MSSFSSAAIATNRIKNTKRSITDSATVECWRASDAVQHWLISVLLCSLPFQVLLRPLHEVISVVSVQLQGCSEEGCQVATIILRLTDVLRLTIQVCPEWSAGKKETPEMDKMCSAYVFFFRTDKDQQNFNNEDLTDKRKKKKWFARNYEKNPDVVLAKKCI